MTTADDELRIVRLKAAHVVVEQVLNVLKERVFADYMILTLVARDPKNNNSNFVVTLDDLEEVSKACLKLKERGIWDGR